MTSNQTKTWAINFDTFCTDATHTGESPVLNLTKEIWWPIKIIVEPGLAPIIVKDPDGNVVFSLSEPPTEKAIYTLDIADFGNVRNITKEYSYPDVDDIYVTNQEKSVWNAKQDAITGTAGQIVGFNSDGKLVAQDAPVTGITQTDADKRYLQLSGGTMNGDLSLSKDNSLSFDHIVSGNAVKNVFSTKIGKNSNSIDIAPGMRTSLIGYGINCSVNNPNLVEWLQLNTVIYMNRNVIKSIGDPVHGYDAANKYYVDTAIQTAIGDAIGGSY